MTLRDFRIGWRLLAREPAYSAIVIGSLALGYAVCFLLLGLVRYCSTYDSAVPDAARVFVLQHRVNLMPTPTWIEFMPLPFQDAARRSALTLQTSAAIPREVVLVAGQVSRRDEVTAVDAAFPAMFGLAALEGELDGALARPEGLVLTASLARQLFGAGPALHQSVAVGDATLRVMAVVADAPSNSTMPYSALVGRDSIIWSGAERAAARSRWQGLGGKIYLRLRDGVAAADMAAALQDAADQSPWKEMAPTPQDRQRIGHVIEVRLRSLPDAYFDTEVANGYRSGPRGERRVVLALGAVALLVLALAAANYLNLATVRTLRREREIGLRKAIGAGRAQLAGLLMAESTLVMLLAYAAGLLLAWLLLPLFAELVERRLEGVFAPASVAAGLLAALAIGAA
ncbi:MAG: ABC transporter permease, partial [Pseudomonadota bacterium]|nr:ABC transporter permease [Pseudomonadota bacterium]